MKKIITGIAVLTVLLIFNFTAIAADRPGPFGLEVGKSTYEERFSV